MLHLGQLILLLSRTLTRRLLPHHEETLFLRWIEFDHRLFLWLLLLLLLWDFFVLCQLLGAVIRGIGIVSGRTMVATLL